MNLIIDVSKAKLNAFITFSLLNFRSTMFSFDLSFLKRIECIIFSKVSMHTRNSTHQMEFNLNWVLVLNSKNGRSILFYIEFEYCALIGRDGCFDCGEVSNVKILIEILLHSSPPYDANRTDLLYVQQVKSFGNRQTFHPNKLEYDLFNIEIDLGPVNLFLHGLFLKKLWWIKENLFGWDQMYHDIREPDLIREKKIIVHDDPLVDLIDESTAFDPRYFRPLMVTLRVALHNITAHLVHVKQKRTCFSNENNIFVDLAYG